MKNLSKNAKYVLEDLKSQGFDDDDQIIDALEDGKFLKTTDLTIAEVEDLHSFLIDTIKKEQKKYDTLTAIFDSDTQGILDGKFEKKRKVKAMNKTINVKKGIYNTCYKLRENKDKSINIRIPYVKWTDNTGTLDFYTERYIGERALLIKEFFKQNTLILDIYGYCGIDLSSVLDDLYTKQIIKDLLYDIRETALN